MQLPDIPQSILRLPSPVIVVSGGREYKDELTIFEALNKLHQAVTISGLIHGCADGLDTIAGNWAELAGVKVQRFPVTKADWNRWQKLAPLLRNNDMLTEGNPDAAVIFPGGNGTHHMMAIAQKAFVPIWDLRGIAPYEPRP